MRVLLINQVYTPDVAATAQHADDLARHLVSHGHEVSVIASRAIYGEKGAVLPKREEIGGVVVHRVGRSFFGKSSILLRALDFGLFYLYASVKALTVPRADVVVPFTTPPFIVVLGLALRVLRGSRCVYWVMDMYPDVPVACGVMGERSLLTRALEGLHRACLRSADRVVVLGRCMRGRVVSKFGGAERERVEGRTVHIGVWAAQGETMDLAHGENPYRERWGLGPEPEAGGKFAVMYSGNFGVVHDVATMCEAAGILDADPAWRERVRFVFVGGGKRKGEVEGFVASRGLSNCVLAPYQPREELERSLSAGDLHLATLSRGIEGLVVPCKLFGVMAASRPCVFIGSSESELSAVLVEHGAGVTVEPGDAAGLVGVIKRLADDPVERRRLGARARGALEAAYGRGANCEAWRRLLEGVVSGGHAGMERGDADRASA